MTEETLDRFLSESKAYLSQPAGGDASPIRLAHPEDAHPLPGEALHPVRAATGER